MLVSALFILSNGIRISWYEFYLLTLMQIVKIQLWFIYIKLISIFYICIFLQNYIKTFRLKNKKNNFLLYNMSYYYYYNGKTYHYLQNIFAAFFNKVSFFACWVQLWIQVNHIIFYLNLLSLFYLKNQFTKCWWTFEQLFPY